MDNAKQDKNSTDKKKAVNSKQQSSNRSSLAANNAKSRQVAKRSPQRGPVRVPKKGMGFSGVLNIILILLIGLAAGAFYYADDLLNIQPTIASTSAEDTTNMDDEIFLLEKEVINQEEQITKAKEDAKVYDAKIKELEEEIVKLEKELEEAKKEAQGKIDYLTKVAKLYENMDAKKAVGILAKMEDVSDVVVILANMDVEKASEIMAGLKTTYAIEVTAEMLKEISVE